MTLFYLIRHAENDWIGKRLPGRRPGLHLNARGRAQAEALARVLADVPFVAIYTSPLERARETAAPLARRHGLRLRSREALAEVDPGAWEGQLLSRVRRQRLWRVVQQSPSMVRFPGGESFLDVQGRVVGELESLRRLHPGEAVACVSHADVIRMAVAYYLGLPLDLFHRLTVSPASVSVLRVEDDGVRLVCLNDTRAAELPGRG